MTKAPKTDTAIDEPLKTSTTFLENDNYRADLDYSVNWNRYFLLLLGCWPPSVEGRLVEKCRNIFLIIICNSLLWFLMITCGLHTFLVVTDFEIKMKLIGPLSFCLMAIMKYYSLIIHSANIRWCLEHLKHDWKEIHSSIARSLMRRNAKSARNLAVVCALFMYAGGAFYHCLMPILASKMRGDFNVTERPLTYPVYKGLMDVQISPAYEIIFITQTITGIIEYNITIGACSLTAALVMHACAQLDVVVVLIEEWMKYSSKSADTHRKHLKMIVEKHLQSIRFAAVVENIMNKPSLVEFVGCTLNICHLGYYFLTEWEDADPVGMTGYFILLISHVTNIYVFCYVGEQLTNKSSKIGDVTSSINWYCLPSRTNLSVILIIAMSFSPSKVTAGQLFELSLNSFASVLQSSLAYLNFLRATM